MKNWLCKLSLVAAFAWLAPLNGTMMAAAPDDNPPGPGDRLQRLEHRLDELAQRQEQMMRRLGTLDQQQERPALRRGPRGEVPLPTLAANPENVRRPWAAPGMAPPPKAKAREGLRGLVGLVFLAAIICNILLSIWIYTDIRKRGEGSGIFIALALVAGIPTAIIYALVRIGDKKA